MRLTTKIIAIIGMFALLLAGVAGFSFFQGWLDRAQEARIDNAFEIAVLSSNLSQAVERAVSDVDGVLLADDDDAARTTGATGLIAGHIAEVRAA